MKLLKLVFIAHGWVLALLDNTDGILNEERVEAWKFGPVIPSLYHEFKHCQNSPITEWSQSTVNETDDWFESKPIFIEQTDVHDKERLVKVLDFVWESYKTYSPWGLSQKTHELDTPWQKTYVDGEKGLIISDELIKKYYKECLHKMEDGNA